MCTPTHRKKLGDTSSEEPEIAHCSLSPLDLPFHTLIIIRFKNWCYYVLNELKIQACSHKDTRSRYFVCKLWAWIRQGWSCSNLHPSHMSLAPCCLSWPSAHDPLPFLTFFSSFGLLSSLFPLFTCSPKPLKTSPTSIYCPITDFSLLFTN